ncbi:MAG: class I SAM-dependent methyltransferase [Bauldia sp.]|nr:class I SAM-dependent methyltransferase [Bauldia sp.]
MTVAAALAAEEIVCDALQGCKAGCSRHPLRVQEHGWTEVANLTNMAMMTPDERRTPTDAAAAAPPTDAAIAGGQAVGAYRPTIGKDFINERHRGYSVYPTRDGVAIDHPVFGWLRRGDALKLYEMAYFSPGDILDLGTHKGLSSTVMAEAVFDAGSGASIVTLEINEEYSGVARRAHRERRLTNIDYRVGDAAKHLDTFVGEGRKFGFAFVDHSHRYGPTKEACIRLGKLLMPGGFVLFHDYADPRNADPGNDEYDVVRAVRDHLPPSFRFAAMSGCCALYEFTGDGSG